MTITNNLNTTKPINGSMSNRIDCPPDIEVIVTKQSCQIPQSLIREPFLKQHNFIRLRHQRTPLLKWGDDLTINAQAYANILVERGALFQHADQRTQGENLFTGTSTQFQTQHIDKSMYLWYEELNRWDYENAARYNLFGTQGLGHFSQLVWNQTTHVGCAGAVRDDPTKGRKTIYVCRYSPPGNVPGGFHIYVNALKSNDEYPVKANFQHVLASLPPCKDHELTIDGDLCRRYQHYCEKPFAISIMWSYCSKTCRFC